MEDYGLLLKHLRLAATLTNQPTFAAVDWSLTGKKLESQFSQKEAHIFQKQRSCPEVVALVKDVASQLGEQSFEDEEIPQILRSLGPLLYFTYPQALRLTKAPPKPDVHNSHRNLGAFLKETHFFISFSLPIWHKLIDHSQEWRSYLEGIHTAHSSQQPSLLGSAWWAFCHDLDGFHDKYVKNDQWWGENAWPRDAGDGGQGENNRELDTGADGGGEHDDLGTKSGGQDEGEGQNTDGGDGGGQTKDGDDGDKGGETEGGGNMSDGPGSQDIGEGGGEGEGRLPAVGEQGGAEKRIGQTVGCSQGSKDHTSLGHPTTFPPCKGTSSVHSPMANTNPGVGRWTDFTTTLQTPIINIVNLTAEMGMLHDRQALCRDLLEVWRSNSPQLLFTEILSCS